MFSCQFWGRKYLTSIWVAKHVVQNSVKYKDGGYLMTFLTHLSRLSSKALKFVYLYKLENLPDVLLFFCPPELRSSLYAIYYLLLCAQ